MSTMGCYCFDIIDLVKKHSKEINVNLLISHYEDYIYFYSFFFICEFFIKGICLIIELDLVMSLETESTNPKSKILQDESERLLYS